MANEKSAAPENRRGTQEAAQAEGDNVTFNILEHLGVLRVSAAGWTRELNYISWCDRPAKFDIREWTPDHKKSTRGITLTDYEMERICEWVSERNSKAGAGKNVEA